MDVGERSFWEAVVQIIPVLLLAMVVEARLLRISPRQMKKFRRQLDALADSGWRTALRYAHGFNRVMWRSGGLSLYLMLLVAILLTAAEFVGLVALYLDESPSIFWMAVAITGLAGGVLQVALAPVASAFGRVILTPPGDVRKGGRSGSD